MKFDDHTRCLPYGADTTESVHRRNHIEVDARVDQSSFDKPIKVGGQDHPEMTRCCKTCQSTVRFRRNFQTPGTIIFVRFDVSVENRPTFGRC